MLPPLAPDDPPLRERELPPREPELFPRDDFEALERVAPDLALPVDLRAPDERLAPDPDDFARDELDFVAPALDRFAVVVRDDPLLERLAFEDEPEDLRAPLDLRADEEDDEPELVPPLELSLGDHLPDMTRCAASATASAMSEPSLVALDTTLLAARSAVSAASRPASRIFLRADGLAAIAAAAAVKPAASISLLIAALASLSTVLLFELELDDDVEPERDDDEREPDEDLRGEELLRADLAIFLSPCVAEKDTLRPFRFPNEVASCKLRRRQRHKM